jgi:hypothetical protein
MHEPLLEFLVELDDLYLGGGSGEDGLNPQLTVVSAVLLGREDLSEDVLSMVLLIFFLGLSVVGCLGGAAHQDWSRVLD